MGMMLARRLRLRQELYIIFTAGHETTANALTFSLYLLAQHPEVEARVISELQQVLSGRLPAVVDVDRLVYLRMVLAESMRLYPPAWAVGRQAIEDVEITGHLLPKDSVVLNCQWLTHRDERWFPNPSKFDPERSDSRSESRAAALELLPLRRRLAPVHRRVLRLDGSHAHPRHYPPALRIQLLDNRPLKLLPTITLRPKHGVPVVVKKR